MINVWKGYKDFIVFDKKQEDELVTSFYLKAEDGAELPKHIPGQFIAIRVPLEDGKYSKARQYTLSMDSKEDYYRVSIKREAEGNVSKLLCDTVNVGDIIQGSIPMGRFVLKDGDSPLVLIGGGIGITPMLSMAYATVGTDRKVKLIYSLANSKNHSFEDEINELVKNNDNIELTTIFTRPLEEDKLGEDFDFKGRINAEWMKENLPMDGEFYFCGPIEFMRTLYKGLEAMGVEKDAINYELFAPGEDITK
ncbi:FAD-binding oxidoreductase [uncultured Clostridium sp.]|uniref:FAD-binding oxidoreductase n=1 Tax=uncultured Clostridium sp. TaxID=59620 RepID=UPI0025D9288D|nr:FAD-binding oxidoreductase [uncultured Clostridium sp.]